MENGTDTVTNSEALLYKNKSFQIKKKLPQVRIELTTSRLLFLIQIMRLTRYLLRYWGSILISCNKCNKASVYEIYGKSGY